MSKNLRAAHLSWLRIPILKSVEVSKLSLDNFHKKLTELAAPPSDAQPAWFTKQKVLQAEALDGLCREIELIHSSLSVAECVGGSSLAFEMKILLNNLRSGMVTADKVESALVSVMTGLITIPNYLKMVVDGAPDSAGILARQINELREIRGVPVLEEDNLLPPDIEFVFVEPPLKQPDCSEEQRSEVLSRAPKRFREAFSAYMSNQSKAALAEMRSTLRALQEITHDIEVGCFWWIGECLLDALATGALRSAGNTLSLIRMLSVAIQKADTDGEEAARDALGVTRFKSLLSALSMSTKLSEETENALAVFNVRKTVDSTSLQALQSRIDSSQAASVKDVVPELKPLLETAMVALGRAMASKGQQAFDVQFSGFRTSLRHIASVFYMVNENELAAVTTKALSRVEHVCSAEAFNDQDLVEDLKSDILFLDERISQIDTNDAIRALKIVGVKAEVLICIVAEVLTELAKTRRLITQHVDSGTGSEDLQNGLAGLQKATSALDFVGAEQVSTLLNANCQAYLDLLDQGSIKHSHSLDLAARAMVAIEVYLSTIKENLEPSPNLLVKAEDALLELGLHVEHIEPVTTHELIDKLEAARADDESQEENHFLAEIVELRGDFEKAFSRQDVRSREQMSVLYRSADRISIAAKMDGHESFSRVARALATYCQAVPSLSTADDFDLSEAQGLLKSGVELCLRCMDDYSARGKVSLFTKDVENALLAKSDPALAQGHENGEPSPEEDIHQAEADSIGDGVEVLEGELMGADTQLQAEELPESHDPGLIALFREEFAIYHSFLRKFCAGGEWSLSRDVCRAAHTLRGISASAGSDVLNTLFGAVEDRFEFLLANETQLLKHEVDELDVLLVEAGEFESSFPWKTETPLLDAWLESVGALGSEVQTVEFEEIPPVTHASNAEQSPTEFSHAETFVAETPAAEPDDTAGSVHEHRLPDTPVVDINGPADLAPEYSEEMAAFYIEEADEVLPELQSNVAAWLEDMDDTELVSTIKRQMHTLKGAALMAEAKAIGAITHNMESLFESLYVNLIPANQDCADLVTHVLLTITQMTSTMRQGMPYEIPTGLINCLHHAVECNEIDLSLLYVVPDQAQPEETVEAIPSKENLGQQDADLDAEGNASPSQQPESQRTQENPEGTRKRSRRGGRGKGAAKRHAEARSGQDVSTQVQPESVEQVVPEELEVVADSLHSVNPPEVTLEIADEDVSGEPAGEYHTQADAGRTEEVEVGQAEEFPHAESSDLPNTLDPTPTPSEPTSTAPLGVDRLYDFDTSTEEQTYTEVGSPDVLTLLQRNLQLDAPGNQKRTGTTEKIKVDLKLLETAAEQSSELTAVRHRLAALNEDQLLGLTAIREKLIAMILQQGQFTTALRGYFNQQPNVKARSGDDDNTALERFTDMSAMQVALVTQTDQLLSDVEEILSFGHQMRNAFRDQGQLIGSLQRDLLDSRLVPFMNVRPKLASTVKQVATVTKKDVNAEFVGCDVIMDRVILENIAEPLTHIIRNAIDHGIETAAERVAAGKAAQGTIEITVTRRAKNVVIAVKDDGRGIDVDVVRKKAIEKGIIHESENLSEKETMRLVLHRGFSTAAKVTDVSGRGVGMDIVHFAVESLGGQLIIDSAKGEGTTFIVELPFTIGSNRAMMCSAGSQWFAIPNYNMRQILMQSRSALEHQRTELGHAIVEYEGAEYEVVHLADLIAMPDLRRTSERETESTLILCEQGESRIAIEVAKVESMPEIHIRKLEGILSKVRGIVGETEMSDGSPVFVLDVMELARLNLKKTPTGFQVRQNRVRSMKRDQKPICLVVDDARGYVRLLDKHFTDRGYSVVTARDGLDALHQLPLERTPDLIVVDVEMPRMNGFEFTAEIRSRHEYNEVPIIMLTTKTGLEEKAYKAGVNAFLNKPYDALVLDQAVAKVRPIKEGQEVAV